MMKSESVPAVFVFSSPCAKFPHYFPHAVVHVSFVTGSLAKVWYFKIVSHETGWTTGAQKCSSLIALLVLCSSRCMDWGMKYSGKMPQNVAVNAVNASCKINLLFWNFGSGVYGIFSVSFSITAGFCGVPIRPNLAGVFSGIGDACTGSCIAAYVLDFLFSFGAILTLFFARLSLGDSYQSGGCDFFSTGWVGDVVTLEVGGVITLEHGVSMPGLLDRVVRWCTRGEVLIIADAVGCVDV